MNIKWIAMAMICAPAVSAAQDCPGNAPDPKPVKVVYATDSNGERAVVFKPNADGVLRATDAATHTVLWSFTPAELDMTHSAGGLMTDARVLRFDAASDGVIDASAGDRVWLYFGLRRGGRYYYALDVTDPASFRLLWKIGPNELPGLGETWSTPTLARARVGGEIQNGEYFVLVLGGGYDRTVPSGHRIYLVDAANGRLLWYAGGPGGIAAPAAPDLALAQMIDAIPARISALDTDGDGFADRLYTADLGGRVWRFDIWNGASRAQLATGGVLASLAMSSPTDARRFYHAPDVALIEPHGGDPYYNLAVGSGDRANPFDLATRDRFYSIRDRNPFVKLTQSAYDALTPLAEADLFDMTDSLSSSVVATTVKGWKLELRLNGGWTGEKVLAEALTANGVILFPTYQPPATGACSDPGTNRVYALSVDQGQPALDFNNDREITSADTFTQLTQGGIADEVQLTMPGQRDATQLEDEGDGSDGGTESTGGLPDPKSRCIVGTEELRPCVIIENLVRTYWRHN